VGLFVSHSGQDRAAVEALAASLRRAGQQVWLDGQPGDDTWWATILEQIRGCDVFVLALSDYSLTSRRCQAELAYAQGLRRPILPVQIAPIDNTRNNPVPDRPIIDYQHPNADTGIALIAAVNALAAQAAPPPDPLPPEPAAPSADLMRLSAMIAAPELDPGAQTQLVADLKAALDADGDDPTARRDTAALLHQLHDRPDTTWTTRTDIEALLASLKSVVPQAPIRPPRSIKPWIIAGVIAAPALAAVVAVIAAFVILRPDSDTTSTPPTVIPDRLDSLLLTAQEINTIMGTAAMQDETPVTQRFDSSVTASNPGCVSALTPIQQSVYQDSGYSASSLLTLREPGNAWRHTVIEAVITFPSSNEARTFLNNSATKWKGCADQTVTMLSNGSYARFRIGKPVGDSPRMALVNTIEGGTGWSCQRVLNAIGNLVIDIAACAAPISNEGNLVADRIAAKAMQ
jgi:hypothetical protein